MPYSNMREFCLSFKPMKGKQWKPYTFYDDFNTPCDVVQQVFFQKEVQNRTFPKIKLKELKTLVNDTFKQCIIF